MPTAPHVAAPLADEKTRAVTANAVTPSAYGKTTGRPLGAPEETSQ